MHSCNEDADSTHGLDALLGDLGEFFSLHDEGNIGELALAEHLEKALKTTFVIY